MCIRPLIELAAKTALLVSLVLPPLTGAACGDDGGGTVVEDDTSGATDAPAAPEVTYTTWPIGDGVFKKPIYQDSCRYLGGSLLEWPTNQAADDTFTLSGPPNGPVTFSVSVVGVDGAVLSASAELADRSQTGRSWYTGTGTATFGAGLARGATIVDGTLCLETRTDTGADISAEFSLILDEAGDIYTVGGSLIIPAAAVAGSDPISVSTATADIDLR